MLLILCQKITIDSNCQLEMPLFFAIICIKNLNENLIEKCFPIEIKYDSQEAN